MHEHGQIARPAGVPLDFMCALLANAPQIAALHSERLLPSLEQQLDDCKSAGGNRQLTMTLPTPFSRRSAGLMSVQPLIQALLDVAPFFKMYTAYIQNYYDNVGQVRM